jgi:hypothetical protein
MKAGVYFTGTGPILVLTSYQTLTDPALVEKLAIKGIRKFIAYELPLELVRERYGAKFNMVLNDVSQTSDLRVLDFDGSNIFAHFALDELGEPVRFDRVQSAQA